MDERRQILVEGIEVIGHHGVYAHEKQTGCLFKIDLSATVSSLKGFSSDQLADTLDYRELAQEVVQIISGPSRNLIEHLAESIADRLLTNFSLLDIEVTVRKKTTGVPGAPEWVGVRVTKQADQEP